MNNNYNNSSFLPVNSLSEPDDYHKIVLTYTRRLEKATKNSSGRINSNELFVTSDQRYYMNEIARIDPKLLDTTVRQFIIENKPMEKEKNISNLREIFTEYLTNICVSLPGNSDEDEEWELSLSQNNDTYSSPLLASSSIKAKTSYPKTEKPWVTKNHTPTKMPEEYEKYVEGIAFLNRYEIVRILKPFGPIEPTSKFWNQIKIKYGVGIHEILHEECRQYYQNRQDYYTEMSKFTNRNFSRIWNLSLKEFPQSGPRAHVIFSGDVVLNGRQLILTLHPPKTGISRRYYRLFSSERFLHVKINMDMNSLDSKQKSILKSLLLHPLPLAGRTYEFLYAKSDILYYFATSGSDLSNNISIKEVIDYNLPIEINRNQTLAKFYSRISLGFSKSTPTVVFKSNEIRYVEDITISGNCFTDGCSTISLAAMKEVAEIFGCKETPSAIQGRIGGAKGIWYIEPCRNISGNKWIELRESQVKYNVNRHLNDDIDEHLRTLEVLSVVVPPRAPGALNSQFIRVLNNGGVPVEVFLKMVKDCIEKIKSEVVGCNDPRSLIAWVMNVSNIMKKRLEIFNRFEDDYSDDGSSGCDTISGFPNSLSEQCIQMLQAGFTPSTCPFLAKKLKCVLSSTLKSLFNKFRIDVPLSRILICIADPTGTLEPGEVFIQLDKEAGCDERTGLPFGVIEGELIVARNPCNLPSDMVKVTAVKNVHLSIYYNVIVFPVKAIEGDISLVAHLSGGDYDGDKIFCCWDPQIVKCFENASLLPLDPKVEDAFTEHKQTVDKLLSSSTKLSEIEFKIQESILDTYFKDLEPTLGLYDRWHRLQSSKFGISDKLSIYLAQMCANLVDATKQGLTIKPNVQKRDNELVRKLPVPYWMDKDNNSKSRPKTQSERRDNKGVMDLLCIQIEKEMKEVNSKEFSVVAKITQNPVDLHISEFWNNEFIRAQHMEEEGLAYKEDLNLIFSSTSEIIKLYNKKYSNIYNDDQGRREIESTTKSTLTTNSSRLNDEFRGVDYEFLTKFLNNPPVENYKGSIFRSLKDRESLTLGSIDPLVRFELQLKAASLYLSSVENKPAGQVCWVIAFRILCNIKAQMIDKCVIGEPRSIIDEVWQSLKIDKKWLGI